MDTTIDPDAAGGRHLQAGQMIPLAEALSNQQFYRRTQRGSRLTETKDYNLPTTN